MPSLFATLLLACVSPTFREMGPQMREARGGPTSVDPGLGETRAYPRPRLVASEVDVFSGRPARWRVADHTPWRGGFRLTLEPEAGISATLDYWIADGLELPVEVGESLLVGMPVDAQGLVLRSADGTLRALVSVDGGYADLVGFTLELASEPSHLRYTEALDAPRLCRSKRQVLAHHEALLRDRDIATHLAPGEARRLELIETDDRPHLAQARTTETDATAYDLLLLDASLSVGGPPDAAGPGDCAPRNHLSWVLTRTR